ncbi:DNA glycosylase, partial [Sporormia fimetaria CBS 119925]
PVAVPPARSHTDTYHQPLLLDHRDICREFLDWFDGVKQERQMPWRKNWIDPSITPDEYPQVMAKRAYEVLVSETMLQQTRVSTVIPYFQAWISKWPTVWDLARADEDQVLAAWKGLGYYGRARRLLAAAKETVKSTHPEDAKCPFPASVEGLLKLPGVGRYTAGAVSSIAFGEPAPVVDGNVIRVLSRQLGLFVDGKDKKSMDMFWDAATRLVKFACNLDNLEESPEIHQSPIPGAWNQALMELGATICTPGVPKCGDCPVKKTCRAYMEGKSLLDTSEPPAPDEISQSKSKCDICEVLDIEDLLLVTKEGPKEKLAVSHKKKRLAAKGTGSISAYFSPVNGTADKNAYCALFPKKVIKKKVPEENCVVCLIELRQAGKESKWLIEQRPAKGLLASLWQFPQSTVIKPLTSNSTKTYRDVAQGFLDSLVLGSSEKASIQVKYVADLGSIVHVFSHLRLNMHVHRYAIDADAGPDTGIQLTHAGPPKRKWVNTNDMDEETLSTGMKKCWERMRDG